MQISELAKRGDVSVATVKFYLREGMLPKGTPLSATRAAYGEEHVERLRLIAALAGIRGLPLARVKEVLELIDNPETSAYETIGATVDALPPYLEGEHEYPRARAAIDALGLTYEKRSSAVGHLDAAIEALEAAGLPSDPEALRHYAESMMSIALHEIAPVAEMSAAEATRYSVLGTALYEPAILALRRLAHLHVLVTGGALDALEQANADAAPEDAPGSPAAD